MSAVMMESVLGALAVHGASALGSADGGPQAKQAGKADSSFSDHLEAEAVKAGAHAVGLPAPRLASDAKSAKSAKEEKSERRTKTSDDDDDDDSKDEAIAAPDGQLLAMAHAMAAAAKPAPVPEPSLTTKMRAAVSEAMTTTAAPTAPAAPATTGPAGKVDLRGMTAVAPEKASAAMMQNARMAMKSPAPKIAATEPTVTPPPAVNAAPAVNAPPPVTVTANASALSAATAAAAGAVASRLGAPSGFSSTTPRSAAHLEHAAVPATATVTHTAAAPAERAPDNHAESRSDSSGENSPRGETGARAPLLNKASADDDEPAKASAPDAPTAGTVTTAGDLVTADAGPAAAAAGFAPSFVNPPSNVNGMTAGGGAAVSAASGTETAVHNAEAVGHKRVLASGDAQGALTVEDLGRFEVRARSHEDGSVDVQVRAEHRDGAAALGAHAAELRADVRVELPRATVDVQTTPRQDPGAQAGSGGAMNERQRNAQTSAEQGDKPTSRGGASTSARPVTPTEASTNRRNSRVRIVL